MKGISRLATLNHIVRRPLVRFGSTHGAAPVYTDRIHRLPELPPPSRPINEHDEWLWPDAQAPEPLMDSDVGATPYESLAQLGMFLTFLGIFVYGVATIRPENPAVSRVLYPGIEEDMGGRSEAVCRGLEMPAPELVTKSYKSAM